MSRDLKIALVFLTRLPLRLDGPVAIGDLAKVVHLFPLVGALVGLAGGLVLVALHQLSLPGWPAAVLAVTAMIVLTGALHEDGLADTADALGVLPDRERALEVMRDSRIGSFGTIALILVLAGRIGAIATLPGTALALSGLVAAAAFSRAVMPVVMLVQPSAKGRGLAAGAGRPGVDRVLIGLAIGVAVAIVALPATAMLAAVAVAAVTAGVVAAVLGRLFGGCTGDTLGTVQQLAELAFLLALVAWR